MFGRSFILSMALVAGLLAAGGPSLVAQDTADYPEYQLKAAWLYNFGRYVEWPKNAVPGDDKTFVIGVLGPNPFGRYLDALTAKPVQDKKIVIHYFPSIKDYRPCNILFISGEADSKADEKTVEDRAKAAVEKTKGSPVLLVADTEGLAQKGIMINFFVEDKKTRLEINRAKVTGAGLKINSKLLGLQIVKIVKGGAASESREPEYHARIP